MEALLAEFFKSLVADAATSVGAEALAGEAAASVAPQAMASTGMASPATAMPMGGAMLPQAAVQTGGEAMSLGQQAGNFATQSFGQQIRPEMNFYNQVTNPNATAGDMARSAFEYSIQSEKDPQNKVTIPAMGPMNPYANMANNTVGGIPSLLQNTQSGLLPYIGAR